MRPALATNAPQRGPLATTSGIRDQPSSAQRSPPSIPLRDFSCDEDKDGEDIDFLDLSDEADLDTASAQDVVTDGPFALAVIREAGTTAPVEPPPYALPGDDAAMKEVNTASMAYQPPQSPALLVTAHANAPPALKGRKALASATDLLPVSPLSLSSASTSATRRTTRSSTHPSRPTYRRT